MFVAVFLLDGTLQLYPSMPTQGTDWLGAQGSWPCIFRSFHSFAFLFCHGKQQLLYLFHISYFGTKNRSKKNPFTSTFLRSNCRKISEVLECILM